MCYSVHLVHDFVYVRDFAFYCMRICIYILFIVCVVDLYVCFVFVVCAFVCLCCYVSV